MQKNLVRGGLLPPFCVAALIVSGCGGGSSAAGTGGSTPGIGEDYTVGGTVSGLATGQSVTLVNGGATVTVSTDGSFSFPPLPSGSNYDVNVLTQPVGVTCTVSNWTGMVGSSNVTDIAVSCGPTPYLVGVAVAGLTSGESVTLLNNGADALVATSNGGIKFSDSETAGNPYDVTVQSQTAGITCTVVNGSGTIGSSDVLGIPVTCNARTETDLYSFSGTDGKDPQAGLVMDSAGDLYGTTYYGGASGDGTVFEISAAGTETVLHSFAGGAADGANPAAGLIADGAGNLYGTTSAGGANGQGTVFKISAARAESVLYSFGSTATDGTMPQAGLIMDSAGNLYGTTESGGTVGLGTVFEISAGGTEAILHSFGSGFDGQSPLAGLVMDGAGNLYGTTVLGGAHNDGTVFEVSATGTEAVLYSFSGAPDAQNAGSGLVFDDAGDLYGTTSRGGANGDGTVYEISATGSERVVFSFGPAIGSQNTYAGQPGAGLVMDSAGNLYGTTVHDGAYGDGSVFQISPAGTETVLYSFGTESGGQDTDEGHPAAALIMDSAGDLYGTTPYGGANDDGTVFKIN